MTGTDKRRWRTLTSVVLCTFHGSVHPPERDYYEVDDQGCNRSNWKPVAVLGTSADVDGY